MRYHQLLKLLFAAVASCVLAAGCSSSRLGGGNKVTGKVMLNGSPVAGAKVIFTDGKPSEMPSGPSAVSDENGEYALVGVTPGSYKVVVFKLVAKKGISMPEEEEGGLDLEQLEASGAGYHALPRKYSRIATTTLVAQVVDGPNEVDLKLTGQADKPPPQ